MERGKATRSAGILLHISSMHGDFGIGDFGPSVEKFIHFLKRTGQKFWQVLPLNSTSIVTGHSPYSSLSAFAGNILFIDPYQLAEEGLLERKQVKRSRIKSKSEIKYELAETTKSELLQSAYASFKNKPPSDLHERFIMYLENEGYWLNDFALYKCLKDHHHGIPWNEWPEKYRDRDETVIRDFQKAHRDEIDYVCFVQFIFDTQWKKIRNAAHDSGIQILGDMPIYVSYDSADVWSNPGLFNLNRDKTMAVIAGVPPDYFNEDGQRWGMPLYKWDKMKDRQHKWFISRIKRNLEWFDLLRLDHFRGFSSYWEIPSSSETAKEGCWREGPGASFFHEVEKKFPEMPFVAEDLGMIDEDVYKLRDQFGLPGMRVLQFGFDEDMSENIHTPDNYVINSVAYTGTHDNNTVQGWYTHEIEQEIKARIEAYISKRITVRNVAKEMIKLVMASESKIAIVPMQDWLGLGEESRMNTPSTTSGNWRWKLTKRSLLCNFRSAGIKNITVRNNR